MRRFVTGHPLQLQKLIRFVMCARYGTIAELEHLGDNLYLNLENLDPLPPSTISMWKQHQRDINRNPSNFLKDHHELERPPPFLIQDSIQNRIIVLHEMSTISADLEQLVQSFISTRLYRTHARMRAAKTQEQRKRFHKRNIQSSSWTGPKSGQVLGKHLYRMSGTASYSNCKYRFRPSISVTHGATPHTASILASLSIQ